MAVSVSNPLNNNFRQQKTHPGGAGDGFWLIDLAASYALA
jgi:hypothetical protein